ncbi:probable protein phosphatase 2C 55 [Nicotiana tomentosiformis]|uniref:probable protein phosphatase 2C 55 n=1 Tax=Nicotiana tomentosiformis TaxID=4098 RepID=UPI00051BC858|nr:probable protein phosphatase 2C 55 [Nicotiana tomentosiformis]XP_009600511.1 probable protein phosphatase 2C 55 [Nicotiana tomentosiformis]
MAVCGSRTSHIGHFVGNITARRLQCGLSMNCTVSYNKRGFEKVRKINMSLRNKGHPNNMLFQYFTTHVTKRWANPKSYIEIGSEGLHNLSPTCFSSGTASAPGVSSDNAKGEEQVANTAADSSEAKIPLKLNSGSFYLPHPAKAKTGGEDAHFMCTLTQAIGVADGVGGWADLGIDAGLYARELMSNSLAAIQEEPKGSIDLIRALDKAYVRTKAKGSSTACIVALTDEGLYAVNLGDSGFMLVRHGYATFKSPAQQHGFNFPYQLDCNNAGDSPSSAMVFKIAVAPGDVLIAGTDGLFDNLYDEDIKVVVLQSVEAGLGPQMTAQRIAELAQQRAMDTNKSSPFSDGAQEAGFEYHGGKLDDITVVVSYIMNNENS